MTRGDVLAHGLHQHVAREIEIEEVTRERERERIAKPKNAVTVNS
jgi:hypothetical protein